MPLPLDNRVLANLYLQSLKGGREIFGRDFDSAVQYFDHCMSVLDRDKAKQDRENDQYRDDRAQDYWDYTKIKNIGHGSKFALHHDGTIMPTRSEANWVRDRQPMLPGDVVKRDREELKKAKNSVSVQHDSAAVAHNRFNDEYRRDMEHLKFKQQIRDLAKMRRRSTVSVG